MLASELKDGVINQFDPDTSIWLGEFEKIFLSSYKNFIDLIKSRTCQRTITKPSGS
jgi:hypothetical protein